MSETEREPAIMVSASGTGPPTGEKSRFSVTKAIAAKAGGGSPTKSSASKKSADRKLLIDNHDEGGESGFSQTSPAHYGSTPDQPQPHPGIINKYLTSYSDSWLALTSVFVYLRYSLNIGFQSLVKTDSRQAAVFINSMGLFQDNFIKMKM